MSEILGYDVDGRPLRAGDWCRVIEARNFPSVIGKTCRIIGPYGFGMDTDMPHPYRPGDTLCATGNSLRKVDGSERGTESYTDQFTPADTGFHELLGQISKQGAKAWAK